MLQECSILYNIFTIIFCTRNFFYYHVLMLCVFSDNGEKVLIHIGDVSRAVRDLLVVLRLCTVCTCVKSVAFQGGHAPVFTTHLYHYLFIEFMQTSAPKRVTVLTFCPRFAD